MDSVLIIETIIEALKNMDSPRFFKTERGFQGRFACALYERFDAKKIFQDDTIIEEEYQKRPGVHRTKLRPDLIVHIPVESSQASTRKENNFVVFEFKKQAKKIFAQFSRITLYDNGEEHQCQVKNLIILN